MRALSNADVSLVCMSHMLPTASSLDHLQTLDSGQFAQHGRKTVNVSILRFDTSLKASAGYSQPGSFIAAIELCLVDELVGRGKKFGLFAFFEQLAMFAGPVRKQHAAARGNLKRARRML